MIRYPTTAELAALDLECAKLEPGLADNWRFWRLFNYQDGLVGREVPVYRKTASGRLAKIVIDERTQLIEQIGVRRSFLRRRDFIEKFLMIRGKDTLLAPMKLNRTQRAREAAILRQERLGRPVRRCDLKGRQFGFTTHSIAIAVDAFLRGQREKALVVSQDNETAIHAIEMSRVMLEELPRARGRWNFEMDAQQVAVKQMAAPQNTSMAIASAKKDNPGRGLTFSIGVFDEATRWEDADSKATSLLKALPKVAGSMALVFATANGQGGWFYDLFWSAWEKRFSPITTRTWDAGFYAWFIHEEYRWTRIGGNAPVLDDRVRAEIDNTITSHEKWLLEQTYFRRWTPDDTWEEYEREGEDGNAVRVWRRREVGWKFVDYDQLAWRRAEMQDHNADPQRPDTWTAFQAEFPATPEEAFAATGRMAFDATAVAELHKLCTRPIFQGEILDVSEAEKIEGATRGAQFFPKPRVVTEAPRAVESDSHGIFARAVSAIDKARSEREASSVDD